MILKDRSRFVQIMLGMADNFRDEISEEGMAMRFDELKDYSMEEVEAAAKKILRYRKYTKMPPIAEFIEALEGDTKSKALEAWGVVIDCLQRGQLPVFLRLGQLDPKINETVKRIGGWDWLMTQTYDDLHWVEQRFLKHYESCDDRHLPVLVEGNIAKLLDKIGGVK